MSPLGILTIICVIGMCVALFGFIFVLSKGEKIVSEREQEKMRVKELNETIDQLAKLQKKIQEKKKIYADLGINLPDQWPDSPPPKLPAQSTEK